MNTKCNFRSALVAASFVWVSIAIADEPLTFSEAITHAVHASPDIEARIAARDAAMSLSRSAGQLPDPELIVGIDNLPITGPDAGSLTNDFMTMRKVGVMQAFPRSSKRHLRTRRASDAEQVALVEQYRTTLDVQRETAQAWIASYYAEQSLIRIRELGANVELQSQLAQANVQSGRTTVADAHEARAALLSVRDRILVAEQKVRRARAELARWVPDAASRPLANPPNFTQLPRAELLSNIHDHASLIAFDAQLDSARSDVALAESEKRPDWNVGVMYAKRGSDFSDMVSVEVRVGLPLFSGSRQDPLIASKRAELKKIMAERDAELRMHTAEVTQWIADWEVLLRRRDVFENETLPLAFDRKQLAAGALQSARGDTRIALIAQIEYVEQQLQLLEIESSLGETWAALSYLQADRRQP